MAMTKVSDKVRNAELDSLTDAIVRKYEAAAAEGSAVAGDAFLKAACAKIKELSAAYTTAIKQSHTLSTKDEADSKRDEAIRALFALAEGYSLIPIPAKKAAGQAVKAVLDKYGKALVSENYASESAHIESLLEDLAALSAEIKTLDGMAEAVSDLRSAQDEFNRASDAKIDAKTNKGASATPFRKPIIACINEKLVPYLSAVRDTDGYADFADKIQEEIAAVNALAAKRGKK